MPLREQLKNDAFTVLNGAINNSVTTITVANGAVFPSTGNFRIRVGDEIMICTARSTNDLTVLRGQEGSSAASASDGADVVHILTAAGLSRWSQDNDALWGYSGLPAIGRIVADDGTTILAASDFTWVNQGSASATDQNGTIVIRAPAASGENIRALVRSAPSAPYVYIGAMQGIAFRESVQNFGMGFRQSSSGKFVVVHLVCDGSHPKRVAAYRFASATSLTSTPLAPLTILQVGKYIWFKLEDDNTNLKFYLSFDGIEFIQVYSESRTAHLLTTGPDQISFEVNNQGSTSNQMLGRLVHWSRVS